MLEGGCLCGAVRYRVHADKPERHSACHCTFCQRRTGSAFGLGAYFRQEDVELLGCERRTYEHRSDETGRWLRFEFCPTCGTQVTWTVEASPGLRGIAVGSLDDPQAIEIRRFGWFRSAHPWIIAPPGFEVFEKGTLPPSRN